MLYTETSTYNGFDIVLEIVWEIVSVFAQSQHFVLEFEPAVH